MGSSLVQDRDKDMRALLYEIKLAARLSTQEAGRQFHHLSASENRSTVVLSESAIQAPWPCTVSTVYHDRAVTGRSRVFTARLKKTPQIPTVMYIHSSTYIHTVPVVY